MVTLRFLHPTRFADLAPAPARATLAIVGALVALGILSGSEPVVSGGAGQPANLDGELYGAIALRVHGGEAYYEVVGAELRERGYATRPFWNWRLPTLAWLTSQPPSPDHARWLLTASSLAALLLWTRALRDVGGLVFALIGGILLGAPLLAGATEQGFLFHEMWAGIWIALSLAAYAVGLPVLCVFAGFVALFVRELALPYVVVMAVAAAWDRPRREAAVWAAGLVAFAVFVVAHAIIVSGHLGQEETVNDPWIRFGGWSFALATARWNPLLMGAPDWLVALWLPLGLLGLTGWRSGVGARAAATAAAFTATFLVAGRPDNDYWGLVCAPLTSLGVLFAPAGFVDLVRAARGPEPRKDL